MAEPDFRSWHRLLTQYRRSATRTAAIVALRAAVGMVLPMVAGLIFDYALSADGGSRRRLWLMVALVASAELVGALLQWIASARVSELGEQMIVDLRSRVFDRLKQLPVAAARDIPQGEIVRMVASDTVYPVRVLLATCRAGIADCATLALGLGGITLYSWPVGVAAFVVCLVLWALTRRMYLSVAKLEAAALDSNAEISSLIADYLSPAAILLSESTGSRSRGSREMRDASEVLARHNLRSAVETRRLAVSMLLLTSGTVAIAYVVGGTAVLGHTMTVGELVSVLVLISRIGGPLGNLTSFRMQLAGAVVGFDSVEAALSLPRVQPPDDQTVTVDPTQRGTVVCRRVSVALGVPGTSAENTPRKMVLEDVSFACAPGTSTAIAGASGAGKSTLLAAIGGIIPIESGAVCVSGISSDAAGSQPMRNRLAIVSPESHVFRATFRENLTLGLPDLADEDIWRALELAQLDTFARSLRDGLETKVGHGGRGMSTGERQRLGLARVFLRPIEIALLDEITANLDDENARAVWEAVGRGLDGITLVIATHQHAVMRGCDHVVVLHEGSLCCAGTYERIAATCTTFARIVLDKGGASDNSQRRTVDHHPVVGQFESGGAVCRGNG